MTVKGLLIRVGVDQAYGGWNAPVDPDSMDFAYVPIPDGAQRPELATPYTSIAGAVARFPGVQLPAELLGQPMHLDPDFERLTYGDNGARRGRGVARLEAGDLIAFFSSLRPTKACDQTLIYALIGVYRVREVSWAKSVPSSRWGENAHTRRLHHSETDIIVHADAGMSGRLRRCIPIGEWRNRSYRVRTDLLERWGHLSCRDGFIQRSAVPPSFLQPNRFLAWFEEQGPELVAANNP
jgi:hypothetical protein